MPVESFLVTALPHRADAGARRHLSLFVTHRLTPDGPRGVLSDFPNVSDWTTLLASAEVVVAGRTATTTREIPVSPHLNGLDPSLWTRVFPPTLTVLPWQVPDPASEPWRTFPAHRMQAHALTAHLASIYSSPVDPPGVISNALARALLIGLFDMRSWTVDALLGEGADRDRAITRRLDALVAAGSSVLKNQNVEQPTASSPLLLLPTDVHLARRYYQRPEEQQDYRAEPDPTFTPVPVKQEPPDFHRRAAMLGDLSPLLRKLGLIIDVEVDDVSTLAGLTEITADIRIPGLANQVPSQPSTACEVAGTSFTARSSTGDYAAGMLRLGEEESFTVLDLDPDASALKLEQYMRNLPRMLAMETNGDSVTSAPATLRGTGFAVARVDRADHMRERLTGAPARDSGVMSGTALPLNLEDVNRGLRLEVWDDSSRRWHSLHRRRLNVDIVDAGTVLADAPDTGFLQSASLTRTDGVPNAPYNAHEVLAGWDGWSLSAPRPGQRVVHDAGNENVVDPAKPAPDADSPVASSASIQPGTLPWLRYGRSYAFRAWAVDLAGNSSPHKVVGPDDGGDGGITGGQPQVADATLAGSASQLAASALAAVRPEATAVPGKAGILATAAISDLRGELSTLRPPVHEGPQPGRGAPGIDLDAVQVTGDADVDRVVLSRRVALAPAARVQSRQARIERAVDAALPTADVLGKRTDVQVASEAFAHALSAAALAQPGLSPEQILGVLQALPHVVTKPRPFLRWEPVLEPTVVPRHAYSEAESLLTLVIRSGVEGPGPDGVTMTVVPPDQYAAAVLAQHPELTWRADSQRHLVAPKTSQLECELHGLFDAAFGGGTDAEIKAALAIALRESGTLTDTTVADLTTPGQRVPQPGVILVTAPTADDPTVTDPADLERGAGLSRGQYAVHDVDSLTVPYLPDPLADGVSFVFPDAGKGTVLSGLLAIEGTRLPYTGQWPEPVPWRLVLTTGTQLAADAESSTVTMTVPPGNQLRMKLGSSLRPESLDLLGIWRSLPDVLRNIPLLEEAAADGWLWWLTPATQLRLVHAVPRPLEVPRITALAPHRTEGDTTVRFLGAVDLHGPSTDRLDMEAAWSEWVDDVSKPAPERVSGVAAVGHVPIEVDEDLAVIATTDGSVTLPDGDIVRTHRLVHQTGDTKHRNIDYRMRAATRFREYFAPQLFTSIDDSTVVGAPRTVNVPSAARPGKPPVRDVLPLLRWHEQTEAAQPFAVSRTRSSGVRIYIDRPWYLTGDDEQLAIVLGSDSVQEDVISLWGADPVFEQQGPQSRTALPLTDIVHTLGLDDRREPGRPVGPGAPVRLDDVAGRPSVLVLGYEPEFSPERNMWFVDVAFDPGTAFWPFVRLAVARYQPSSLAGLSLSPIVKCDFVQLLPTRTALVSRPDETHARIVVTGPVGLPRLSEGLGRLEFRARVELTRVMRARLERRVPAVNTDLGWQTVATTRLPIQGVDGAVVSWEGEIELPKALAPQRPGTNKNWRVVIEEAEILEADPSGIRGELAIAGRGVRIVYADIVAL
jgi:hypothetical protein